MWSASRNGLSIGRVGYYAELSIKGHSVGEAKALKYSSIFYLVNGDYRPLNEFSGGRNCSEGPIVGAPESDARYNLVAFGYLLFDGGVDIRESGEAAQEPLTTPLSSRGSPAGNVEIGLRGEQLFVNVSVALVYSLNPAMDNCFVGFGHRVPPVNIRRILHETLLHLYVENPRLYKRFAVFSVAVVSVKILHIVLGMEGDALNS